MQMVVARQYNKIMINEIVLEVIVCTTGSGEVQSESLQSHRAAQVNAVIRSRF